MKIFQLIAVLALGACMGFLVQAKERPLKLLVLHSYSTDYAWTNEAHEAISKELQLLSAESILRAEYMDTKNTFSQHYLDSLAELYRYKYVSSQLDGIILTDNNALSFFQQYGARIFPGVPAVASGINAAQPPTSSSQVKSVIAEIPSYEKTLDQALTLFPQTKRIYILSDASSTGKLLAGEMKEAIRPYQEKYSTHFLEGLNQAELNEFASQRRSHDLIYLLPYFRSTTGEVFSQGQVEQLLASHQTSPVFVSWSFQLGTGALGGSLISAGSMGEQALDTLLQFLSTHKVVPFQANADFSQTIYDARVLQQFGIQIPLPFEAKLIHQPKSFYREHQTLVWTVLGIFLILGLFLLLLALNLKKQKALNRSNQRMMKLDREIIETQRELVTTLGEVIEVRSHETRHHVRRVSKICRLLGEELGMPEWELELLEAASSMHDIGKIGIPESVLHKAGEFSPEERELMKTHCRIGRDILKSSKRELIRMCRTIAYQHHEHWDGSGYPNGILGEEISIHARITTLADVYDAVSSDRCYKNAWPEHQVLEHIQGNRGIIFDPQLVDIFMANLGRIRAIRLANM